MCTTTIKEFIKKQLHRTKMTSRIYSAPILFGIQEVKIKAMARNRNSTGGSGGSNGGGGHGGGGSSGGHGGGGSSGGHGGGGSGGGHGGGSSSGGHGGGGSGGGHGGGGSGGGNGGAMVEAIAAAAATDVRQMSEILDYSANIWLNNKHGPPSIFSLRLIRY